MPFELNDLGFMQEATKEALAGLVYEFAKQHSGFMVLSGVEVTGASSPYNVSEGYVMLNYEICHFPAQTSVDLVPYIALDSTYDPEGSDVFYDGVTRDTYEVRKAKRVPSGTPSSFLLSDDRRFVNTIGKLTAASVVKEDSAGTKYTFVTGDIVGGALVTVPSSIPAYAIKKNGRVALYGKIEINTFAVEAAMPFVNLIALPVGFRQTTAVTVASHGQLSGEFLCAIEDGVYRVGLSPTHLVAIEVMVPTGLGLGTQSRFNLNGIVYDVET
jgi:hypothetical protein